MEKVNRWALEKYRVLTKSTIITVLNELEASISGKGTVHALLSPSDAYALASRFKNVLDKYPFFKRKHHRILRAIIDRCGEAYYKKDPSKLYVSREVVDQWSYSFYILPDVMPEYLRPLLQFKILEPSDKPEYVYKISDDFFHLMGPVAQYLIVPVDTRKFTEMMAIASGISSIYVMAMAVKNRKLLERKVVIPWFVKLPMIYTLTGLEPDTMNIRNILEISRINYIDKYFVIVKGIPVEWWRSVRAEAFEFMANNTIIEDAVPIGYKLNKLWIRVHEEGVRRYVRWLRWRYERRYR